MSSTFSISAKPFTGASSGSFQTRISAVITRREEIITAPRRRSNTFPGLTKEGIPHTDLHVREVVERQSRTNNLGMEVTRRLKPQFHPGLLEEAYEGCRKTCAEYTKTFYLGTRLMTEERQKAIWAIYVWCRRTDELVDGPNAIYMSASVLDRWEESVGVVVSKLQRLAVKSSKSCTDSSNKVTATLSKSFECNLALNV